jgi:hypothetical protein
MSGYFQLIRKLFASSAEDNIDEAHESFQSDKKYELDGEDRVEWDAAWSRQSHRKLELPLKVERVRSIDVFQAGFGKMVSATISEDPVEFSDLVVRKIDSCPICGLGTMPMERVAACIHPEFQNGIRNITIGVWVHKGCFQRCPVIEGPAPVPW